MKRLLCFTLAIMLLIPTAFAAAADVPQDEKALVLAELEIMVGDENGNLNLDRLVTRSEFTKLLVAASVYKDSVGAETGTDPYPDVRRSHWSAPYVRAAMDAGLVRGMLDGTFHPDNQITLAEGVTMMLRLLGYQDSDFNSAWPTGQMARYRALSLDTGVTARADGTILTRQDALHLFYNLLTVKNKSGTAYIATLGHTLNVDGEVDVEKLLDVEREGPVILTGAWEGMLPFAVADALIYRDNKRAAASDLREWDTLYWADDAAVLWAYSDGGNVMSQANAAIEGPVVATGNWQSALPFDLASATVARDAKAATAAAIQTNDVIYWSKYSRAVYAYSEKVTGVIDAVAPSLASPTSVTIAGKTYTLEGSAAAYALSDLGTFRKGNAVTLLIGRTGGAAAVIAPVQESGVVYGIVTAIGKGTRTDTSGNTYTATLCTITTTDGAARVYEWADDNVKVGNLAQAQVKNGVVTIARLSSAALAGKVNGDGTALGSYPFADNIAIIDTYGEANNIARVWPSRLAGVRFDGDMVRYYALNQYGEISHLILNNVTGDLHTYGVLTEVILRTGSMTAGGTYTYNIGGTSGVSTTTKTYSAEKGPFQMRTDGTTVDYLANLTKVSLTAVEDGSAKAGNTAYTLDSNVLVYVLEDKEYTASSLNRVTQGYTLTGWYDKPEADGGRIRVIVAEVKK